VPCLLLHFLWSLESGRCRHLREGVLGGTICSDESRCADFRIQIAMAVTASKPAFLHYRVYEKLKIEMLDVTYIICP
jgi:hypothetical protein